MIKLKEDYTPHPLKWWHWPLLLLLIVGTLYIAHEYQKVGTATTSAWKTKFVQQVEGNIFGTIYHITYESQQNLETGIRHTLQEVDSSLSPFNPHSVITGINNNTSTQADKRLAEVVQMALTISRETDGAFDITVAPLVNAWGFGFKNAEQVGQTQIDSIRQFVGYEKLQITINQPDSVQREPASGFATITKQDPRITLDCSAIAKGYGVDAVGLYLESQGVTNYMVEIGGEVRLRGCNPKGERWHIGVTTPTDDLLGTNNTMQEVLEVSNISMATSGNYRNYYEKDNKKYAHTIDPRTGYPVQHSILSATVLAQDCAMADAYATAFMVEGLERAKHILGSHPELKAYLIYTDEKGKLQTWYSEGLIDKKGS